MCKDSNSSVMILINFIEKKIWASYFIYRVKGTFGLRGSSYSEANHASINYSVIQHTEGVYCAIQELKKRQKSLMDKNHTIICQVFYI